MAVIAAILTAASVLQYAFGEPPPALPFAARSHARRLPRDLPAVPARLSVPEQRHSAALRPAPCAHRQRQSLLDIYPRPGHAYIGSAIFGLHMPVWSVVIGLVLLFAFAIRLAILGGDRHLLKCRRRPSWMVTGATVIGGLVTLLAALNFGSVVVQCGLGECHTMGYALLGYTSAGVLIRPPRHQINLDQRPHRQRRDPHRRPRRQLSPAARKLGHKRIERCIVPLELREVNPRHHRHARAR